MEILRCQLVLKIRHLNCHGWTNRRTIGKDEIRDPDLVVKVRQRKGSTALIGQGKVRQLSMSREFGQCSWRLGGCAGLLMNE